MMWSLLAICLLLNMFVAIIMESYDKVNEEEEKVSLADFVRRGLDGGPSVEVVVSNEKEVEEADGDEGGEETSKDGEEGKAGAVDHKLRQDMELVLAALVDFRRDMKALNKRVQQIT